MSIPLQGQEPGWQSLGGSVFPSPEEAPSATSPGTEPTGTSEPLGTGTVSAELSRSPGISRALLQFSSLVTDPEGMAKKLDTSLLKVRGCLPKPGILPK